MMTPFDDWLASLRAARKGPVTFYADRGRVCSEVIRLAGDFTGSTMRGEVRLAPDAAGTALATFAISAASYSAGYTSFSITLPAADVDALPAATIGEGSITLAFDLLITIPGANEELLFGGPFIVYGRITE